QRYTRRMGARVRDLGIAKSGTGQAPMRAPRKAVGADSAAYATTEARVEIRDRLTVFLAAYAAEGSPRPGPRHGKEWRGASADARPTQIPAGFIPQQAVVADSALYAAKDGEHESRSACEAASSAEGGTGSPARLQCGMSRSRRQFLKRASATLAVSAAACRRTNTAPSSEATPGAPPAFGAAPPVGPEISATTIREAEKLVQVEYGAAERQVAADSWRRTMAPLYERRT